MRDNHLISVSKMLTPPENAIKIEEVLSHKLVGRNYKVAYDYEKGVEAIVHYRKIFGEQGYVVRESGQDRLLAEKNDIVIEITCRRNENRIMVYISFDDIYKKLGL